MFLLNSCQVGSAMSSMYLQHDDRIFGIQVDTGIRTRSLTP